MISADKQKELHNRLIFGDPTAGPEIFQRLLEPLTEQLKQKYRGTSPETVEDCAMDAFWDYYQQPERYDPSRGSLCSYLRMSVEGDIKNTLESAASRHEVGLIDEDVEAEPTARNTSMDHMETGLIDSETHRRLMELSLDAFPCEKDRVIFSLILEGESDSDKYAKVLEIENLPPKEKRAQVKRTQDRIKKVLRRLAPGARNIVDGH